MRCRQLVSLCSTPNLRQALHQSYGLSEVKKFSLPVSRCSDSPISCLKTRSEGGSVNSFITVVVHVSAYSLDVHYSILVGEIVQNASP